jgi:hypothetical protein
MVTMEITVWVTVKIGDDDVSLVCRATLSGARDASGHGEPDCWAPAEPGTLTDLEVGYWADGDRLADVEWRPVGQWAADVCLSRRQLRDVVDEVYRAA